MNDSRILYSEVQRFGRPLLWAVIVPISALGVAGAAVAAWQAPRTGEAVAALAAGLLLALLLPVLLVVVRMTTEVRSDGVLIRYSPFTRRRIGFGDIRALEARTYRPLQEYGGWGVRWWFGGKRAYSVSGNRGVELTLADGRKVMIGSTRPEDLEAAIRRGMGPR